MLFGLSTKALGAIGGSVVLLGVIVGTAAVLAEDGGYGTVEAPEWKSGYKWAYDITGQFEYVVDIPGEVSDSATETFGPFSIKKEILNSEDFSNEGESLYVGAATLPLGHILSMDMFYLEGWADLAVFPTADRHRDLAPTLVWPDYECNGYDCEATDLSFGPNTGVDYIDFPLTYGKRWSESVALEEELGMGDLALGSEMEGITEIKMIGEAGKMEVLQLPIGATEAIRLDFSYQPVGLQKVIAEMREQVEAYGVDVERLNVQIGLHEIAHYSPEYQAIVQDQFVVRFLVDAAFSFQGDRMEVFTEASAYTVAQLTGAELADVPDRTTEEILAILNGQEAIKDVEGQTVSKVAPYTVDIIADRTSVNAASQETAHFKVDVEGEGLPEGHSIQYVVLDYFGEEVARGIADDGFSYKFVEPGTYTILAGAFDEEGRLISQDGAVMPANYYTRMAASCQALDNYFMPCESVDVPVRGGIEQAILRAEVNETVPDAGIILAKELQFEDAAGRVVTARSQGGGIYHIELDGEDMEIGDGELTYRPVSGFGESLTYDLILDYGSMPEIQHAHSQSGMGLQTAFQDWRAIGGMMQALDIVLDDLVSQDIKAQDGLDLLLF